MEDATHSAREPRVAVDSYATGSPSWPPPPRCPLTPFRKAWRSYPGFPLGGRSRALALDWEKRRTWEEGLVGIKTRSGVCCLRGASV
ncbi:hypothetical protein NN561_020338 [Cricetulus griseus]